MREEYSLLKVCEKRVRKYEEAAGDCIEKRYIICMFVCFNTGCPRRNVPDFRRVFLMLEYTDTTQNTYVQS